MKNDSYVFNISEAKKAGLTKREIAGLIKAGAIERLARGVYRKIDLENDKIDLKLRFEATTLLVGGTKSAICLSSALSYYGLTNNEDPIDIMVPFTKRCSIENINVFRSRNPNWEIGITQREGYRITTLERTLVDSILAHNRVERDISLQALQVALDKKMTDLHKMISMAGQLKVIKRIGPILSIISQLK